MQRVRGSAAHCASPRSSTTSTFGAEAPRALQSTSAAAVAVLLFPQVCILRRKFPWECSSGGGRLTTPGSAPSLSSAGGDLCSPGWFLAVSPRCVPTPQQQGCQRGAGLRRDRGCFRVAPCPPPLPITQFLLRLCTSLHFHCKGCLEGVGLKPFGSVCYSIATS